MEKKIFKCRQCILLFVINFPCKKTWPFSWTNLIPLHAKILFINFRLKLAQWFVRRNFLKILSMYLHYFEIISPWKRVWYFIWTNLNSLHPRMLRARFGWNLSKGSGKEVENVKSLQTDRRMTSNKKSSRAFSSGELIIPLLSISHKSIFL